MSKTLLVDGDNLFKIGFHGAKDLFNDGSHVGGVYHFINTLRRFLEEYNLDKVVVFWDGESNSSARKLIYPQYKANRRFSMDESKYESYLQQKNRVKQYLEEVFVRQVEIDNNEADDLIAYYCGMANDETIIIFSSDKDLTQLITGSVFILILNGCLYLGYLIQILKRYEYLNSETKDWILIIKENLSNTF